jgi:hypothetical protein
MESYIVRIYRRFHNSQGDVAGLVETVGSDEKKAFQSFSGLITAIRHAIGHGADPAELRSKPKSYQDSEVDIKKRAG